MASVANNRRTVSLKKTVLEKMGRTGSSQATVESSVVDKVKTESK